MSARTSFTVLVLGMTLVVGCGSEPSSTLPEDSDLPPEVTGPTHDGGPVIPRAVGDKIRSGGFDDAANVGSVVGTQWGPTDWSFLQGSATGVNDDTTNEPDACLAQGNCQDGNLTTQLSTLAAPANPDANPNPDGLLSTSFAFEHVGPFRSREPSDAVSRTSGIRRSEDLPGDSGWELAFDWAFLSGNAGTGHNNNDYAEVVVVADGAPKQVFKISRDDVNPEGGSTFTNLQDNSCATGQTTFGGVVTTPFLICTGWRSAKVDVSEYRGKTVEIQIITHKVGNEATGTFFAFDNVRFTGIDVATVPVSLGLIVPSPLFIFAGRDLTAYSLIKGGVTAPPPTASWAWGDGTTSSGTISTFDGWRFAAGQHNYPLPATYSVTATVRAADGGTASRTQPLLVLHRPGAITLSYVCGNKFRLLSQYPGDVTVTWNVFGTADKGSLTLPANSEAFFTTNRTGFALVFLNGILIQTKANGRIPCT